MNDLTTDQEELLRFFVQEIKAGKLDESFKVLLAGKFEVSQQGVLISNYQGSKDRIPQLSSVTLDSLEQKGLIVSTRISKHGRIYTLTQKAYETVDNSFNRPETVFMQYLESLADVSGFDEEIKNRCLPILEAGSSDSKLWGSAVRTAGFILEKRLRDIGGISDPNLTGKKLVDHVFGQYGTLSGKFSVSSERNGYYDLYAGIVQAFRNPFTHRLIDPLPEEGGAFIMFVNLLLKKLEDLR